jgi:malonyl-CoA O-methyltransferase
MTGARKARIARAFSEQAGVYDGVAIVQQIAARRLAERIGQSVTALPKRILEIGCGTGFLSARLGEMFPESDLLLTDISPSMLQHCRARLGDQHRYQVLDGEHPEALTEKFDLIASSLAFQWFDDLRGGMERLGHLLAPGGRMVFTTLGRGSFAEWRRAHADFGLPCGAQDYPGVEDFPWPDGFSHRLDDESVVQNYDNGMDFARSLKILGAREPAPGHKPLAAGAFRRLLASLEGGFSATYHLLYGEVFR